MKPLNRVERSNAFLGFLILFFITIGVIVTVIFFSIEVPLQESKQLRKTVFMMQKEKEASDSFAVAMRAAMYELENFDLKRRGESAFRVEDKIEDMRKWLKVLPDSNSSIYASVVKNIEQLNEAKKEIGILKQ